MSNHFNDDFWPEILQWLPAKSLVRFRRVCRSWKSLISSSSFIARHLSCSASKPRLLASHISQKQPFGKNYLLLHSDPPDENAATHIPPFGIKILGQKFSNFEIVGTVNGVICLWTVGSYGMDLDFCPSFVLWNPLINKYIELPRNNVLVRCDVYPPGFWFGFGFKASENDFRVLFVSRNDLDSDQDEGGLSFERIFRVQVCSVHYGIWRDLPAEMLNHCIVLNPNSRCLLNGVLHLVASNDGVKTLLLFDFEKEVFSFMGLPESASFNVDVAVYKDKLAALDYVCPHNIPCCKIWSMNEYGDPTSWVCVFGVNLIALTRELNQIEQRIVGFTANGQIIIAREDGTFILYDSARRMRHRLGGKHLILRIYACGFVESLVFMDGESKARSLPSGIDQLGLSTVRLMCFGIHLFESWLHF